MATILIVDAEQPLRELLADVLESNGHRVMMAGNGREALIIIARDRRDRVVSDVMMPLLKKPCDLGAVETLVRMLLHRDLHPDDGGSEPG